jgi:glycerol-3-phosphate dehydrogenase
VKLYDLLCGGRNLGASSWMNVTQALQSVPGLNAEGLQGAVRYFDGFTNDARLVLDTLRSAVAHGAKLLNYAKYCDATHAGHWRCQIQAEERLTVQTRTVVNASGPWAHGLPHSAVQLRLTKGIHLVVDGSRLPIEDALVMTAGARILFAIPWAERIILGTTDTDYQGSLEDVRADAEDVDYVLRIADSYFPSARLRREDVISTWAGLRPLIADPRGNPSEISRSHEIKNPESHWWDVAGGKLTTCRLMAEQTVDRLMSAAQMRRVRCTTTEELILAHPEFSGLEPAEFCQEAVTHFCQHEWAQHLTDVMIRRSGWHYYFQQRESMAEQCALWMAQALHWDGARLEAELKEYRHHL